MTSFYLKIFAIMTMVIDHIGYIFMSPSDPYYLLFRGIGRLAFPVFIWFVAEGCNKTKNLKGYLLRLMFFALLSEVPFDYAFSNTWIEFTHQNIFFTLFLGAFSVYLYIGLEEKLKRFKNIAVLSPICLALIAEFIHTDYGGIGVLLIYFLYMYRNQAFLHKAAILVIGNLMLLISSHPIQSVAAIMLIPLYFYNGQRGKPLKYFFYIFYPAHLLILGMVFNLMK